MVVLIRGMKVLSIFIFSLFPVTLFAQSNANSTVFNSSIANFPTSAIRPLGIGDKVPDILFKNVINYKSGKAKLSDFAGKLVILDFWATWCGSCIDALPKIEKLQNKFAEEVQFILVNSFIATHDDTQKVAKLFSQWENKHGKPFSVLCAIDDIEAAQLFEHVALPHYVWINREGTVIAITSTQEVNEVNIYKAINNIGFRTKQKVDFKSNRPIYLGEDFKLDSVTNYAVFLKGKLQGVSPVSGLRWGETESGQAYIRGWAARNMPLIDMFKFASRAVIDDQNKYSLTKRFIVEVEDSTALFFDSTTSQKEVWEQKNLYTFDIILPPDKADSLYHYITEQLNFHSDYRASIQNRMVKSWILVNKKNSDINSTIKRMKDRGKDFVTLSTLVGKVNRLPQFKFALFDETNFQGKIYVDLDVDTQNFSLLKKALSVYGLEIIEGMREMKVYVVTDK